MSERRSIKETVIDKLTPDIIDEMKTIHFISDLHFGHNKIIEICGRPTTIENHNKWLIEEVWNKYIGKKDTVYILGDLSFENKEKSDKILDKLHGKKKFMILGNHDKSVETSTRFTQITQIKDFNFSLKDFNIHVNLCHYPILEWNRQFHGSWHLYGHSHCRPLNYLNELAFDVSIDRKNWWRPYNLYQICYVMHYIELGKPDDEIIEELLKMEI